MAEAYLDLGDMLRATGQDKEAETIYRLAIDIHQRFEGDFPNCAWRLDLARLHNRLGMLFADAGRSDPAEREYQTALALVEKQDRRWAGPGMCEPELARAYEGLGNLRRASGEVKKAEQSYRLALAALQAPGQGERWTLPWFLATCADPQFRDPRQAVKLAKRRVEGQPQRLDNWTTLGAAHCAAGDGSAAIEALTKSMQLRDGGDSLDRFLMAIASWQTGKKDEARKWYAQGVELMKSKPGKRELRHVRTEAAELLGIPGKKN